MSTTCSSVQPSTPPSTPTSDLGSLPSITNTDHSSTVQKDVVNPPRKYIRTGIGGAGNYHKIRTYPSGVPTVIRPSFLERCKRQFRFGTRATSTSTNDQAAPNQAQQGQSSIDPAVTATFTDKRDSIQTSKSESPLIPEAEPNPAPPPYSSEPPIISTADRIAAKLFGIRK